jgi:ABC-2 type transport system permease protein
VRRYLALARTSLLVYLAYRAHFFFTLVGTVLGIVLQYLLWKAVFAGAETLKGMSFNATFTQVALSSTVFTLFTSYVDWDMCFSVIDGSITPLLIKPTDFQFFMLFSRLGGLALGVLIIALPAVLIMVLGFRASIPVGPGLAFFAVSLVLSFLTSYFLEFTVGVISFKTNSVWGISEVKNVLIRVLSGSVVPLAFFPGWLKRLTDVLPFKAMYDVPMRILLTESFDLRLCLRGLALQLFWVLAIGVLSRVMFARSLRSVNISGG